MGQPVAFFEVLTPDPPRAHTFYAELFGWKVDADPAMGGFGLVDTDSGEGSIPGGIGPDDDGADHGVRIYMRVDDLDAYLTRALQLGGTKVQDPTELPDGFGSIAVFADPDGNQIGLWA